jgi:NDP-sugar pyrophosphorylase family protein
MIKFNGIVIIPMAGLGTRFSDEGFTVPKPLIKVSGKSLIEHSIESLGIDAKYIFITRKYDKKEHNTELSEILSRICPNHEEICIDYITKGAVETCLLGSEFIDENLPLIITNCDQRLNWDPVAFLEHASKPSVDGSVVTYNSTNPKNSFAIIENDVVTEVVEKKAVSNNALVGIHYWKRSEDFLKSGRLLVEDFCKTGRPECYVSETYNYLIRDRKTINNFHFEDNQYIPLGTPYDLTMYEAKLKEFHTEKPKTIFCDIDGTILKHVHRYSDVFLIEPELLDGVRKKIDQWDSYGHKIIFCTARKESSRKTTEKQLRKLGLCWDYLIMGVSSGVRVLINDKLEEADNDRALAVNVITNKGFNNINWEKHGL